MNAVIAFCGLCILLLLGKFLRVRFTFLQKLYLPSSVIGGIVGLVFMSLFKDVIPGELFNCWGKLPGFLINIVFAALFLGVKIPGIGKIWKTAGPQLAYGQIVAWGQYLVGIGIVLLLLGPLFGSPDIFGVLIPVGFEGGHGTAGGLADTFSKLGFPEGRDLGLASATVGMVSGIIIGMALINWAVRKGIVRKIQPFEERDELERKGLYRAEDAPSAGRQTVAPDSIDSLALHLSLIGLAVLIGYGLQLFFRYSNQFMPSFIQELDILNSFPLFPLCMIGGLLVQLFLTRSKGTSGLVSHGLMQRLSGTALDFLVVSAIATIKIQTITDNFWPFILLCAAGILWNVFCLLFLARRLLPNDWFERSIAEMGQSMGVTATGLLLLRTVDPESETEAPAAFGYKQLLHEPFMGGGLWTSTAVPLVIQKGGFLVLLISVGAIGAWLILWYFLWGRKRDFFS